jgi:hypothetical protein
MTEPPIHPAAKPEPDPSARPGKSKLRPFTIEELIEGMTPVPSEWTEDDWPVGEELI